MIQQKHAFMIETESVRRMFRAKPSMNVIVVQLLVDFPFPQLDKKKSSGSSRRKTLVIDRCVYYFRTT